MSLKQAAQLIKQGGMITALTGAGISAASGIPTFRGPEGYWTVGSAVYMPEEMATLAMFQRDPHAVWRWYLYRLGACLDAEPNAAHHALVTLERALGERFTLITQNIDNLHLRAGHDPARTYQIHGNIQLTRCSAGCHRELLPLGSVLKRPRNDSTLTDEELNALRCTRCGGWLRPQVLWFDESYDEQYFRFDSAMRTAGQTDVLLVIGTSGATSLPDLIAKTVFQRGKPIIDINPQCNPFSRLALGGRQGLHLAGDAAVILPKLVALLE